MRLLIFLFFIVILFSCTKKKVENPGIELLGLDYYPLTKGKFVVYEVDSTVYNELPTDTVIYKYLIKEKVAASFIDNLGNEAYTIERYIKFYDPNTAYDSMPWKIKEVWMLNATDKSIQVSEGNIRYTKLVFPVQEKASWNGNASNTLGEQIYVYDYIEKKETLNNNVLNNVLLVKQLDYTTLISSQQYFEKYAKGIGLVSREITDILSNNVVAGKTAIERIESGIIYKQILVTYGYE
jgi:hypothetical protein